MNNYINFVLKLNISMKKKYDCFLDLKIVTFVKN